MSTEPSQFAQLLRRTPDARANDRTVGKHAGADDHADADRADAEPADDSDGRTDDRTVRKYTGADSWTDASADPWADPWAYARADAWSYG